jgi:cytosine/adenosine deaminase-related metal-dependent hydrolase
MGTVFHDATLVQFDPPRVERGDLRQEAGRIVAVGAEVAVQPGDEVVDCAGAVLMPGLVNGHTHLYSALAVGMPVPDPGPRNFHEILQNVWWRLDRAHTLPSVEISGTIGALVALRCGTTTLVDHHASPQAIAGSLAALEAGIARAGCRAVLCYETTCRNGSGEAHAGLEENRRYLEACHAAGGSQFAGLVGAHASFTLDDQALDGCVQLARQFSVGVHIHAAEDPVDQQRTYERTGLGLIDRFEQHGLLELPGTLIAHGTHFTDQDLDRIEKGAHIEKGVRHLCCTMAHNPASNMNNGVGYGRPARYARPPMLGTDGIGANLFAEARTALFKSHDANAPLDFSSPLKMLGESARFASRCLGVPLGLLEVGAAADLVLTIYQPATPLTAANLTGHLIYALGPEHVRDVMIAGHWALRRGQIVICDERAWRREAVEVSRELHRRMVELA